VWNDTYAAVAAAAQELIAIATGLGASVYREASLVDLSHATESTDVVIVLAHFRGFNFSVQDFIGSFDRVTAAIKARSNPMLGYFENVPNQALAIVDAFNEAVMGRKLLPYLPSGLRDAGRLSEPLGRVLCRDLLDESLDGIVRPGNQIDLFDGLHSLGAVEAAISSGFRGALDLALCNSIALATYIDLRRNNSIPCLYWPDLIHPIPQFVLIGETLRRLSREGGSYINTRMKLEREMLQIDWSHDDGRRHYQKI
jgi:hypothetical protein